MTHPVAERGGKAGELVSRDRMTHQRYPSEMQRIQYRTKIGDPGGQVIPRWRLTRSAIPAAGNGEHVKVIGEPRCEVIESVSYVLQSGEKDQRSSRPAPVEHFQRYPWSHCDESPAVRRGISPACCSLGVLAAEQQ